ncbi:MAG: hypothetical protein L0I24_05820 [Pseudonocardia sp.]|nr:hypothetical protein [Pseudonocardia sp.]
MILCDTGPIVAAALVDDDHHHACVELFTGIHLAGRPLLVPGTVAAEVGYMLARESEPARLGVPSARVDVDVVDALPRPHSGKLARFVALPAGR